VFEDTKEVIRIRKSKKNRQHNSQMKKDKQRSIKHTHKPKDWVTRIPLKLRCNILMQQMFAFCIGCWILGLKHKFHVEWLAIIVPHQSRCVIMVDTLILWISYITHYKDGIPK
jgi:hypothetical protein